MFNEPWETYRHEKVVFTVPVRYLIIDMNDQENQGLYKESVSRFLKADAITLVLKEAPTIDDILILEFTIGRNVTKKKVRVSCGVERLGKDPSNGFYEVDLKFIVMKETDREFIESYIREREQAV